jgi:predicted permease
VSWRRFVSRAARDRDRRDEFDAHVALYVEQLVARGRTTEEARREARLRFGNARAKREEIAEMNRLPLLDTLSRDVSYAVRILRRSPAFALTAIVTLAIVIGANSAVFSLANSILLKPLPYPEPDRLAVIDLVHRTPKGLDVGDSVDGAIWEAIRDRAGTIDAAVYAGSTGANLVTGSTAAYITQQRVGAGYFHVLGVAPFLGREFSRDEDVPGGPAVTVISYDMWQRVLGGRPDVVGQTMRLKGEAFQVIGVMPSAFQSISKADVWTPVRPSTKGEGSGTNYGAIARLRSGVTWDAARQQLAVLGPGPFANLGDDPTKYSVTVDPMQASLVENERQPLIMLGAAVAAVLVIACVNIAALLLSRGGSRAKEIATRMALGSGRSAVVRQLLVESLVLAAIGGAAGLAVGALGLSVLKALGGETFESWTRATLDGGVMAVMAGVSLLTSVCFGLIPAWQASRIDVNGTLQAGASRSVAGGARRWPRMALVVAEVTLGVALLVATGLMLRTFVKIRELDPGFNPAGIMTATASLQDARYRTGASASRLFNDTLERLSHDPDIASAGVALCAPFQRLLNMGFRFTDLAADQFQGANVSYVAGDYFQTLGVPLKGGRFLAAADDALSPKVVVVSELFAKSVSDDKPVLGRWLHLADADRQVVGVVGNILQLPAGAIRVKGMDRTSPLTPTAAIYVPAAQAGDGLMGVHIWFSPVWVVRSRTPVAGEEALRRAISMADPQLPIAKVETMNVITLRAIGDKRLLMTIIAALALAALLLSAIGIHGLIAQQVSERRREFGIRLALGASPAQTIRQVALGGIWLAVAGVALGLGLAYLSTDLVKSFLWNVQTSDPPTYAGAAAFLLVIAAVASLLPALSILRLNPAVTLRD